MDLANSLILVTGAGGFIGRIVVDALLRRGAQVRVLLGPTDESFCLPAFALDQRRADIRDLDALRNIVPGIEIVIHLAGPASVAASFDFPEEYVSVHVTGTSSLVSACQEGGVRRLIYISSAEVYGQPLSNPVREDHPLRASSPYGAAKIGAELSVARFADVAGIEVLILRPFSIYGPGHSKDSLIGTIMRQVAEGEAIRLHDPTPIRDYCYVSDLAEAIVRGCFVETEGAQVVNIGTGIGTSAAEVARLIMQLKQIELPVLKAAVQDRPTHSKIECLIADPCKARKTLGWQADTNLQEGLNRTINQPQIRSRQCALN